MNYTNDQLIEAARKNIDDQIGLESAWVELWHNGKQVRVGANRDSKGQVGTCDWHEWQATADDLIEYLYREGFGLWKDVYVNECGCEIERIDS